jgi:hypothetical protein
MLKQLDVTSKRSGSHHDLNDGIIVLKDIETPQGSVLLEKLTVPDLIYKFPAFYRN